MISLFSTIMLKAGELPDDSTVQGAAKEFADSVRSFSDLLDIIIEVAIMAAISFVIIQLYRYIWKKWWKRHPPQLQQRFVYNVILIMLYVTCGIIVVTRIPGSDKIVSSLITSSGFLALGVGLAAQEALGNIINGMMISVSKPFNVGDRIHLVNGKITGYVEDITLRHTVIRTFVNSRIIVPNSTVNKDMIENSNYQQGRASSFIDVTITFDSDVDKAKKIMADIIGSHPDYLDTREGTDEFTQPKVKIFIRELGLYGVELRGSMWTKSTDDNFEASSDVRYEIQKQFKKAGILLAQTPARPAEYARAGVPDQA